MDIVFTDNVHPISTANLWPVHFDRTLLLATLHRATTRASISGEVVLTSFTQPVGPCDALAIYTALCQQGLGETFFWAKPEDERSFVGVGATTTIETSGNDRFKYAATTWRALQRNAVIRFAPGKLPMEVSGPILFGGFAFDPLRPATPLWDGFPTGLLVLPRLLFSGGAKNAALTVNLMVAAHDDIEQLADKLTTTIQRLHAMVEALLIHPNQPAHPGALTVHDILPASTWKSLVASSVHDIQQGAYQKIVLARAVQVTAEEDFALAMVLRHLCDNHPSAYVFAFQRGTRHFVGATPERLVFAQDGLIRTMALAGSAPRGVTELEDRQFGMQLLHSEKNRHEHAIVVTMVRDALARLSSTIQVAEEPHLLKLQNIQHLQTSITGGLLAGHSILEALQDLHPTPAVGGFPREAALSAIRTHEQLDRGWYASPIGWIDKDGHGEFAVALRSGLIDGNTATLFAGCGIVADSDPESEYTESCLKLKVMLHGLAATNSK